MIMRCPAACSGAHGNVYEISGVAIDTHGNASKKAKTTLTVTQPAINNTTSEFTPAKAPCRPIMPRSKR